MTAWIQTYSGRQFWPLEPRAEDVCLDDIAHPLAHQCRYAGHCGRFYSVAEHCVLMTNWLWDRGHAAPVLRAALLHDAAEAYLTDLPRPIKHAVPAFGLVEGRLLPVIFAGLGVDWPNSDAWAIVKEADDRILLDERAALMTTPPLPWGPIERLEPLGVTVQGLAPEVARHRFLSLAWALGIAPRPAPREHDDG